MSKICKKCKSEIDNGAKICPNCRKKQGMPVWLIILIVFLFIGMIGTISSESDQINTESNNNTPTETIYNIGETIKTGKYEIIVTSVEELSQVGTEYFYEYPKEGATFIAVNFKYKNITGNVIKSYSLPSIKLVDIKLNTKYDNNGTATTYYELYNVDQDVWDFDDLAPGVTANDSVVFEVSKELYLNNNWQLYINADKALKINIK